MSSSRGSFGRRFIQFSRACADLQITVIREIPAYAGFYAGMSQCRLSPDRSLISHPIAPNLDVPPHIAICTQRSEN